jgi:hypothetical protein
MGQRAKVTAQAAPLPGAGQVVVDAEAEGAGPSQRESLGGSGGGPRAFGMPC